MIMNSKKKVDVFGVTRLEEINDDYSGLATDTATVNVNNTDRTISVDVNYYGMLGEESDQAYPGHLGAQTRNLLVELKSHVDEESKDRREADTSLKKLIEAESWQSDIADNKLRQDFETSINNITTNYATKNYVYEQLSSFSKLSKQIVDSVNTEENYVVIDGQIKTPADGIVYLVKDEGNTLEDSYKQYTSIDGNLILIGTTQIDLTDYATKEFVIQQIDEIPEVDLTDYAKKEELPDVSQFISAIPPEYITEEELEPYASKVYVQTELSKVGTLSKQVVDSIDLENNTITIDGILQSAKPDVVYLLAKNTQGSYAQYTIIDEKLTWIGDTDVDLKGYATQEFVEKSLTDLRTDFMSFINGIEFIDGGNAPL